MDRRQLTPSTTTFLSLLTDTEVPLVRIINRGLMKMIVDRQLLMVVVAVCCLHLKSSHGFGLAPAWVSTVSNVRTASNFMHRAWQQQWRPKNDPFRIWTVYPVGTGTDESDENFDRIDVISKNTISVSSTSLRNSPLPGKVQCTIQVVGVGGGGGNAVNHMTKSINNVEGVTFWTVNTDAQALTMSQVPTSQRVNIGRSITRGLGAGGDPSVGAQAAVENSMELKRIVHGSDLVFITCGMGGGTGSGAAPVLAEIAKSECDCLTVGVVTKPFAFEGRRRMQQAEEAIATMLNHVDTLIVVSNDKLLDIVPENAPITEAFAVADDVLRQAVIGITEIILRTGLVNVDFADVKTVMKDAGYALLGIGTGNGPDRAVDAALSAISSPLLDRPIRNAKRVVFNMYGGPGLCLSEINAASAIIYDNCDEDANIIFGALIDPDMGDTVSVTVLACDFESVDDYINAAVDTKLQLSTSSRTKPRPLVPSPIAIDTMTPSSAAARATTIAPDVFLEDPRVPIKRGFKRPEASNDNSRKRGGLFGLFRGK